MQHLKKKKGNMRGPCDDGNVGYIHSVSVVIPALILYHNCAKC